MANAVFRFVAFSSLVVGATVLALPAAAQADPRVGVTSATSGGPRGKPPAAAERVLHVGVDVQANEVVTTGIADRAHLLFLDGSSLTVGPQARLVIDRFVYDPNTKTGALAVTASQGVFRFVGGKISKTQPVVITTPSATLTIRGGIMLGNVGPVGTTATFMHGIEMTATSLRVTKVVTRTGWQIFIPAGKIPGDPVQVPPGGLIPEMAKLEALQGQFGSGDPDQVVTKSGFSAKNSGLGPYGGAGPDSSAPGTAANATSDVNVQLQKPVLAPTMPTQPPPVASIPTVTVTPPVVTPPVTPPSQPPGGTGPGCGTRC